MCEIGRNAATFTMQKTKQTKKTVLTQMVVSDKSTIPECTHAILPFLYSLAWWIAQMTGSESNLTTEFLYMRNSVAFHESQSHTRPIGLDTIPYCFLYLYLTDKCGGVSCSWGFFSLYCTMPLSTTSGWNVSTTRLLWNFVQTFNVSRGCSTTSRFSFWLNNTVFG